jgi:hypothetical protein
LTLSINYDRIFDMYTETTINPIKYVVIGLLLLGIFLSIFLMPLTAGKAQTSSTSGSTTTSTKKPMFSDALAANTLCSAGLQECKQATEAQAPAGGLFSGLFGGSGVAQVDPIITVVNVPGETAVYRIVNGQKHSLPTTEIFESYGFSLAIVQSITKEELDQYPLARSFIVQTEETDEENPIIYYLTESGRIRPVLNDKVFYSYGDRKEDIITINQKEFNYYPRSEFIYLERPKVNREVYQITGGIKRYLTPVAVKRMNLQENEISPVNQIEFDEYPEGEPIIF